MTEPEEDIPDTGFAYFMIRIPRTLPDHGVALHGVVERLGSGEKQRFGSGEQLIRLLDARPRAGSKMQVLRGHGNLLPSDPGRSRSASDEGNDEGAEGESL